MNLRIETIYRSNNTYYDCVVLVYPRMIVSSSTASARPPVLSAAVHARALLIAVKQTSAFVSCSPGAPVSCSASAHVSSCRAGASVSCSASAPVS